MKSIYKVFGIAATFLLLQSCIVAKDYESPDEEDIVKEEKFRTDSLAQQDSTSLATISWRDMFTDPILQSHIERALSNNIDIRIALQHIAAANAYVKQGKAGYLPRLNAGADVSRSYPSKNSLQGQQIQGDHIDIFDVSANLSWEADIWGKIRSQKRGFEAAYLQTMAAHQTVKTELIANIATAYYQLLALDEQIKVTEETVETRQKSLETTEALKEAGAGGITSLALQQTRAQYISAKAILVDLEKEVKLLENTISMLLGDEPHAIERSRLDVQRIDTELKIGVPAQLLGNRPDVIAAENQYRQAFEMTNVARANFYPSLSIGAEGGFEGTKFNNWFETNSLFANIFGGLTAPIFNGRQIRTQYEVSKIEQEEARLDYRQSLILAGKEVSDALYAYQAADKKVDLKEEENELLEKAVEDAQELLSSGYNNFSYLEVLTAQESVLNSNLDVVNEKVNKLSSMVELYRALGGGWN